MRSTIDITLLYTLKELQETFKDLDYKINNVTSDDFGEIIITLQTLELYFFLSDRLGNKYEQLENDKSMFEKLRSNVTYKYQECNQEQNINNKIIKHTINIAEKHIKKSFTQCMQKDVKFGYINNIEINLSNYVNFLQSNNSKWRKEAYYKFYGAIDSYKYVLLNLFILHLHMRSSLCLNFYRCNANDCYCIYNKLPINFLSLYFQMFDKNLCVIHEYYNFKAKKLKCQFLDIEDVMAPLYTCPTMHLTIEKAYSIILEALRPLGNVYINCVKDILEEGRIDIYDNDNKFKGAYTVSCFQKGPFTSINFNGSLNDLFSLIHEIGHCVQYKFALKKNSFSTYKMPYIETEIPSIVNEFLLYNYFEKNCSFEEKKYYIFRELEDLEGGLFRQSRFAKFEYMINNMSKGEWDYKILDTYKQILLDYYGVNIKIKDISVLECMRTPQLYENFYVMNYCFGTVIALQISKKITNDFEFSNNYLNYLSLGNDMLTQDRLSIININFNLLELYEESVSHFRSKIELLN